MGQRDQLALGVRQVRVDRRREGVLLVAAVLEVGDVGARTSARSSASQSPSRLVFHGGTGFSTPYFAAIFGHTWLRATISCNRPMSIHPPLGCIAGRVSTMTLVVTPARGSATPIKQSRVTISVSWSSVQPSVPSGRIGMTMKRFFWFES